MVAPAVTWTGIPAAMREIVVATALLTTVFMTVGSTSVLPPAENVEFALEATASWGGPGSRLACAVPEPRVRLCLDVPRLAFRPLVAERRGQVGRGTAETDGVVPDGERFQRRMAEIRPTYFVITELDELAGQTELAELLRRRYCVRLERPDAIVYDLRTHCTADPAVEWQHVEKHPRPTLP